MAGRTGGIIRRDTGVHAARSAGKANEVLGRGPACLVGTFALTALAGVGLYGVMAFGVATRRRKFGIRLALGAVGRHVMGGVLSSGIRLIGLGLLLGAVGAVVAARLLASELFEVGALDPLVLAGTSGVVVAVAVLGCWLPARAAARVDPIRVLRQE